MWIDASSGTFTVNQSSSTTSLSASGEIIGFTTNGKGVYNQSNGSNTITNALVLGIGGPGSSGKYTMTGGAFSAGAVVVGPYGTGTFTQSSNTVKIGSYSWDPGQPFSLIVGGEYNGGTSFSGTGTYTNNSGTLNITGGAVIGQAGSGTTGTFSQSSGKTSIGGHLIVGNYAGATGKFTMSSGNLSVTGYEIIGNWGDGSGGATGTFTQSAGNHTIGGFLDVGHLAGSSGTFKMTSGSLSVTGSEFIGDGGVATFTQTSGSNTAGGDFILGYTGTGTYNMTSGSLKVTGDEVLGNFGNGTFSQTSGSNSAKTLTLAAQVGSTGTYNITSGSVSAPNGFQINGSTGQGPGNNGLGTGTFNVLGSAGVTGPVTNNGTVNVGTTSSTATVTWNNTFTNDNAYNAGNATGKGTTNTFVQDLVVTSTGYINATSPLKVGPNALNPFVPQDVFIFKGNFDNESTQSALWNTSKAKMEFIANATNTHTLTVSADGSVAGHPFMWYTLTIDPGQTLDLAGTGTQWLNVLTGVTATSFTEGASLTNIFNNSPTSITLVYDKALPGFPQNAYLGGHTYVIPGINGNPNGVLTWHTPLPPSVLLLGSGLLGMGFLGWRRKRMKG